MNKKIIIPVIILIIIAGFGTIVLFNPSYEGKGSVTWSIDYDQPTDSFPKDLVDEKISEVMPEHDGQYKTTLRSPTEYLEWLPIEAPKGHEYNENTHGFSLNIYVLKSHQNEIKKMLEEIPGVTKVTIVSTGIP